MPLRILFIISVYSFPDTEHHHPPLGLGYIASSLTKEYGDLIECRIINDNLAAEIRSFKPDIVGISTVSKNYLVAKEQATVAKSAGLPVIIGGVHITFLPQTLTDDMDVGIIGEGENTVVEVIASFINHWKFDKTELRSIKGVVFRDNGALVITQPRALIKPLDLIPYPARDLLEVGASAHMLSSRGCPYSCAFCSTSRLTRKQVRYASAEYVANEIEEMYKTYRIEYLTLYDDLFALNSDRVVKIQELLGAKNLIGKFGIAVNLRADTITDELAEVLRQMNVKAVGLGVESGCQKTIDYLKTGGITVEKNINAIRILKKHHIIPYCSFILGSPYENKAEFMQTLKFIKDHKIYHFDICMLTPYPGTPVWDYAERRGLVSDDMDWTRLDFYVTDNPVILSERISRADILELHATAVALKHKRHRRPRFASYLRHSPKLILRRAVDKIKERGWLSEAIRQ